MSRPIPCQRCAAPTAIPIEYGLPDDELIAQAGRGEVVVGGDLLFEEYPPNRYCTSCRHEWAAAVSPGGRPTVRAEALALHEYGAAVRTLRERTRLAVAVCEAVDRTRDVDSEDVGRARAELGHRVEGADPAAGLDGLVLPDDHERTGDLLDAATAVCLEVDRLRDLLEADRDHTELADVMRRYVRARAAAPRDDDEDEALDDEALFARLFAGLAAVPEPDDGWAEVADLAAALFPASGSALAWARHAWGTLGRAGLTAGPTEVERARAVVRLVVLSALHQEFAVRAFDSGWAGDWRVDEDDVVGAAPRVDPFWFGVLAERDGADPDDEIDAYFEDGSVLLRTLRELVRCEHGTVVSALRGEMTPSLIFATLWLADRDGVRYPLPAEAVDLALNAGGGDRMTAYSWVDDGMGIQ